MKFTVYLAFALGLGTMITLIWLEGAKTIAWLLASAGWPLLLLVPLQAAPLLLDVLGWKVLIVHRVRLVGLFGIAAIRQAINRLLPVANVGGDLVGIRLLMRHGVDGPSAAASVIIELMIALGAQFVFALVGAACVLMRSSEARLPIGLALGLAFILAALAAATMALRRGRIFSRLERLAIRYLGGWLTASTVVSQGAALDDRVRELFATPRRLFSSFGWQLAGLVVGSSETLLALYLLGHPVTIAAAIALESLIQAAKSVLFMVPAAVGVQEAGLIGVGRWFGLDADAALALSLAKRMREILFGVPALAIWQWTEGQRIARRVSISRLP